MNLETVIGLEIHAELKSKTKIFCLCSTKFGAKPNVLYVQGFLEHFQF